MAEINGGIPASVKAPEFNPLQTITSAQALGTGMLQNRLLGQQVDSKIALGQAVTGATDPATGKTDWSKAIGSLSQDPKGSFAVPELAGQVLDRQIKELQLSDADLSLAHKQFGLVGETVGALLANKEPLTRDAVTKSLVDNLVSTGVLHDEKSLGMLASIVQGLPTDDAGLRAKLKNLYLTSNLVTERVGNLLGTPSTVSAGDQTIQQQVSPLTGEIRVNGVINQTRSPSEKASLVRVWDPASQTYVMKPSGQIVGDMAPGALPGGSTAAPVTAEAPMGTSEAAAASVGQAQQLRVAAEKVPESNAALLNIRNQLSTFKPGPKANWTYLTGALATQLGWSPEKVKASVASQEEFNKLATQFINAQVGALGGSGTDSKLEAARHGSPNEFMSREGIMNVTNLMIGLNDALAAKNAAWQKWLDAGNSPATYGKFQTDFNKLYNPRVFQSVYMTDAQRQVMMKNMTADERKQFQTDWTFAHKAGWIK